MRTRIWRCDTCKREVESERRPANWASYSASAPMLGCTIPGTPYPVKGEICDSCFVDLANRKIVKAPNG